MAQFAHERIIGNCTIASLPVASAPTITAADNPPGRARELTITARNGYVLAWKRGGHPARIARPAPVAELMAEVRRLGFTPVGPPEWSGGTTLD